MGGTKKKATGRVKQAIGAITGDKGLQRRGRREERLGSLQGTADDATDAVHEKVDGVIEHVSDEKSDSDDKGTS